ncbi:hypothetical protein QUB78_03050 [Microcoleus sp. ARI1-A4]
MTANGEGKIGYFKLEGAAAGRVDLFDPSIWAVRSDRQVEDCLNLCCF